MDSIVSIESFLFDFLSNYAIILKLIYKHSDCQSKMQKIKGSKFYKVINGLLTVVSEKRIDTYSAGAAFYIFISFVPFILILLSTVKYLPFTKQDLVMFIEEMLPAEQSGLINYVIDEMYAQGVGVLSISILAALWASAKGVLGITKGLNEVFGAKDAGNYLYVRTKSAICTLLLMLGMILMLVISVFGNTITSIVRRYVIIPSRITGILAAKDIIMFFVLFVLFMFFFCVLPARKISVRSQIYGAAGAGLLWILFTKLFSFYLSTFNGYSMYGSFAIILIIGVWLYVGMYIMFMGALANELIASRKGRIYEGSNQ